MRNPCQSKKAFTLIELLTVIAIIGILAAILIPVVGAVRESARNAQCMSNLRQIAIGIAAGTADNGDRFINIPRNPDNPGSGAWPLGQPIVGFVIALDPYLDEGAQTGSFPGNPTALHGIGVWRCPTTDTQRFLQWPYYPSGWMWNGTNSANLAVGRSITTLGVELTQFPVISDRGSDSLVSGGGGGNFGDFVPNNSGTAGYNPHQGWHSNDGLNVGFADGSVRRFSYRRGDDTSEFARILRDAMPSSWTGSP